MLKGSEERITALNAQVMDLIAQIAQLEAELAKERDAVAVLAAALEFYTKNLDSTFAAGRASVLDYHWRDMVDDGIKNNPIARAAVEGGNS